MNPRPRQPQQSEKMPSAGPAFLARPEKSPNNSYTFGNIVALSPRDVPPSRDGGDSYVLINDSYVLSARPLQGFPPGSISLSDSQRQWAQIAFTDSVKVQAYDPFASGLNTYLVSMDVEIGFASSKRKTDIPYDQDELSQHVIRTFENQIFAPTQRFMMDLRSIPLLLSVKTIQLGDLSMQDSSAPTVSDPLSRGILTRNVAINFYKDPRTTIQLKPSNKRPNANAIIQPNFKFADMGIGGLDQEFGTIFRRAFASRVFPPGIIAKLGIQHVKGILLHGPPGTGKTLIARQIGKMLNGSIEPKIINGPEVLNKFVGQSEENIRKLFADAEKEQKEKGDESGLHIIIFDELDAVCKQRGSGGAGSAGVGDSVVNQLLSKLDGVDQLNNVLMIGMTNRIGLIDDALLRPGRLEVHVEISLPDEPGRLQIFKILTAHMSKNNALAGDVDGGYIAKMTPNYSGAELAGVVRSASSTALSRHVKVGTMASVSDNVTDMQVTMADFVYAMEEVQPAFGVSAGVLEACVQGGILPYSPAIGTILHNANRYVETARRHPGVRSVLFYGPQGAGKTALAAKAALDSGYPFVKLISASDMKGFNEAAKVQFIDGVFADAYKSPLSLVLIDDLERIIEWSPMGGRFQNTVLTTLTRNFVTTPPKASCLLVLATSSKYNMLQQLDCLSSFDHEIAVPAVRDGNELRDLLRLSQAFSGDDERDRAVSTLAEATGSAAVGVGIKRVLGAVRTSEKEDDPAGTFVAEMEQRVMSMAM